MTSNQTNYFSIDKVDFAVFREGIPGNTYRSYSEGRGVCGIAVALKGKATYTFKDGSTREMVAGDAALFSDKISYIIDSESSAPFCHYTINFSLSDGYSFPSDILIKPVDLFPFVKKCEQLLELWNSGKPTAMMRCTAVLYELIADIMEQTLAEKIGAKNYNAVMPAIHHIDENFASNVTLESLAKMCAMSQTNFRRAFSAVCGTSPIQYLIDVRLKHAMAYLNEGILRVAEISSLCGFKDVEHFCRTFKKKTGMTPKEARNTHRD